MRWIAILSLVSSTMACPASEDKSGPAAAPAAKEAAKAVVEAVAGGGVELRPLKEPLPGGFMPSFPYNRVLDMTDAASYGTTRNATINVTTLTAEAALKALATQWSNAGFKMNEPSAQAGELVQDFWIGGDGGITKVVAAGGAYIKVSAKDYKPDDTGAKEGNKSLVIITVNTKGI